MRVRVPLRDVATTSSAGQALQRHLMSLSAHLEREKELFMRNLVHANAG